MELKVGDILYSKSLYHGINVETVERVTNTQIVLKGNGFSKIKIKKPFLNGCVAIGTSGYGNTSYYLPNDELRDQFERKLNDKYLSTYPWTKLSNETMVKLVEYLRTIRPR